MKQKQRDRATWHISVGFLQILMALAKHLTCVQWLMSVKWNDVPSHGLHRVHGIEGHLTQTIPEQCLVSRLKLFNRFIRIFNSYLRLCKDILRIIYSSKVIEN